MNDYEINELELELTLTPTDQGIFPLLRCYIFKEWVTVDCITNRKTSNCPMWKNP